MVLYPHLGQYFTFLLVLRFPFFVKGRICPAGFIVALRHEGHLAILVSPPWSSSVEVEYFFDVSP